MSIELKDAMKIFPFSRARLVAGEAGLSRPVISANIQEVPNVDRWMKGGEILFTSGYAFQSAENGCRMMERLDEVGISALAIKPGQYLRAIPKAMADCANRLGMPLFELPQDLPYMDCIIAIYEQITQKQLSLLRRVDRVHAMLTQTILNKEGMEGICSILQEVTGNPVFITNQEGVVFACKTHLEDEAESMAYRERVMGKLEPYFTRGEDNLLRENQCNVLSPHPGLRLLIVPIAVQEKRIGYLILDMVVGEMLDVDMVAFEQAGSMVAVEFLNEQALWQREQKIREQLLEDLLMKHYGDEKLLVRRGRYLGFDMTGRYCLFAIDADAFEERLKNEMVDLAEERVQSIKSQVQQKIRAGMGKYHRPCLVLDRSMGVIGMFNVRRDSDVQECTKVIAGIVDELNQLNTDLSFSAGIGRVKQGIRYVEKGCREALLAMRAGRALAGENELGQVHTFDEVGCLSFLCELADSTAMREFYEEYMDCLRSYDKENGAELIKTLKCYFACGTNLRQTAERLYVHKNSVIYRLGKIEALLGKKLNNPQTAFDLQLCLTLQSLLRDG